VLAALVLIWGTTWAAIRIGLGGIPPFTGAALRFALASVVLLIIARLWGVRLGAERGEKLLWVANAVLTIAVPYGLVYWGEQWVPSGLASVVFATFTLFVAILAHFFLEGDRMSWRGAVGVVVGFGGIAVLFSEDLSALGGPHVQRVAVVMLLAPLASAVGQIVIKRHGGHIHPLSVTAVPMGLAALVFGVVAVVAERDLPILWNAATVGSVLYLAVFGSALAFTLYYWLLRKMTATRLSLVAYVTPVVAVAVGIAMFGEPFTVRTMVGSAAVIVGVALVVGRRYRRPV
jgi:drug/metabolite transporter (DMT)-like permease